MVIFKFRAWPLGPNLLAAGVYNLRGWRTLFLYVFPRMHPIAIRLPLRAVAR